MEPPYAQRRGLGRVGEQPVHPRARRLAERSPHANVLEAVGAPGDRVGLDEPAEQTSSDRIDSLIGIHEYDPVHIEPTGGRQELVAVPAIVPSGIRCAAPIGKREFDEGVSAQRLAGVIRASVVERDDAVAELPRGAHVFIDVARTIPRCEKAQNRHRIGSLSEPDATRSPACRNGRRIASATTRPPPAAGT